MEASYLVNSMEGDSRRSSILFGIHSESKALQELERVRRQNRRFSLIAALAIFLLVAALICVIVWDLLASTHRTRPELISPQSWQTTQDVQIGSQSTRRWGKEEEEAHMNDENVIEEKHANHRYSDNDELLEERTGFKPQPFRLPNEQNLSANHFFPPAAEFNPPVRFRGIYIHPTQQPDERNQEYYQKINDWFTRTQERNSEPHETTTEISDLYTKALFPARQPMLNRKNSKPSRRPFTVMLDIYPMNKDDDRPYVEGQKPRDAIFVPMRQYAEPNAAANSHHLPQIMLPPKQRKNRMFMKLNLFPKAQAQAPRMQKRTWLTQRTVKDEQNQDYGEEPDEEEEEEEEEVEDEEDEEEYEDNGNEDMDEGNEHNCNGIVGHNPYGKPISAKWKAPNGEWVHAKYVSLNQWNDRNDPR